MAGSVGRSGVGGCVEEHAVGDRRVDRQAMSFIN